MATVRLADDQASSLVSATVRIGEDSALADAAGRAVVRISSDAASSGALTVTVRLAADSASTDAPAPLPTSFWRLGTDGSWHPLYAGPL